MKTYWVSWPLERKLNMKFVFKTRSLLRLNWLAESGFPVLRGEQPRTEYSFSFVAPWRPWDGRDGHTGRLKLRLREGCPACDGWRGFTSLLVSNPHSLRSPVSEKWKCVSLSHAPFRSTRFPRDAAHIEPRIQQLFFFFIFKVLHMFSTSYCS